MNRMCAVSRLPAIGVLSLLLAFLLTAVLTRPAPAQTFTVLYSFTGGADGAQPYAQLIKDTAGNLYGTTAVGGNVNACNNLGCGVVFKLTPDGKEKVLYTFTDISDGVNPWAGLLLKDGFLYGTTEAGGTNQAGTIFKMKKSGAGKTILYNFAGPPKDGSYTFARLVQDSDDNLYGTTYRGGKTDSGTVFKLDAKGKETVIRSFKGGYHGENPWSGVVRDSRGNLYGVTYGDFYGNYGTVFKIDPTGQQKILHHFSGGADGGYPYYGGVVLDKAGSLYGTTSYGGTHQYFGTVFKVEKNGKFSSVYSFTGQLDGGQPNASLVRDSAGNLYGTTIAGGAFGHGVIYKIDGAGTETVLYSFQGGTDPALADANLMIDTDGTLYGTSALGGDFGQGTVFKLTQP